MKTNLMIGGSIVAMLLYATTWWFVAERWVIPAIGIPLMIVVTVASASALVGVYAWVVERYP